MNRKNLWFLIVILAGGAAGSWGMIPEGANISPPTSQSQAAEAPPPPIATPQGLPAEIMHKPGSPRVYAQAAGPEENAGLFENQHPFSNAKQWHEISPPAGAFRHGIDWDMVTVLILTAGPLAFIIAFILLGILVRLTKIQALLQEIVCALPAPQANPPLSGKHEASESLAGLLSEPISPIAKPALLAPGVKPVEVADAHLAQALREALSKPQGELTNADLAGIKFLNLHDQNIAQLDGLQHCVFLETLNLTHNQVTDLEPIMALGMLAKVYLSHNPLSPQALQQVEQLRNRGVAVIML